MNHVYIFLSRLTLVSGLKWVDEVIPNAPYEITEEFMNTLFNKYSIDYIIHGDDPCLLPDGTDAYALAKKVGRYKQIKRTEGVSSTDIVGKVQWPYCCFGSYIPLNMLFTIKHVIQFTNVVLLVQNVVFIVNCDLTQKYHTVHRENIANIQAERC